MSRESLHQARVVTLGCRLNALESAVIRCEADAAGLDDAVVVNTCAVTGEAVRQARQTIRKLRREHPDARIIVSGCAAQLEPAAFAAMPEVDLVLGNREKLDRRHLAAAGASGTAEPVVVGDIMTAAETAGHLIDGFEGRSRAFVQIQQGCDHRCTFCIIPFARGPNRSVPTDRIISQVRRLVAAGFAEVVLTGVDICSWRSEDGDGGLGRLVRQLLGAVPELARLRLSTVDPAAIDDELIAALAGEPRLMPHLHLSLQAADDLVLKRMKRRHDRAMAEAVIDRARAARPEIVFGADLIAGFPTETEAMFGNTLAAIDGFGLTFLHVFPYSPRRGTPAARMPQVPAAVRRERAARLRNAGSEARNRYYAGQIGQTVEALVEKAGRGRGPDYAPLCLVGPRGLAAAAGTILPVRITGQDHDGLMAGDLR